MSSKSASYIMCVCVLHVFLPSLLNIVITIDEMMAFVCVFYIKLSFQVFLNFCHFCFRQIEVTLGNQLIECQECHSLYHQVRYLILIWYL